MRVLSGRVVPLPIHEMTDSGRKILAEKKDSTWQIRASNWQDSCEYEKGLRKERVVMGIVLGPGIEEKRR